MKDVMVICVPVAQHKHHESQHQTLRSLWGAQMRQNQASWLNVDYPETLFFSSFTSFRSLLTSAFYGLGSKVALSGYARLAWGCGRDS